MALTREGLQTLIRMHRLHCFQGPLLTLGVQDVHGTYEELEGWFHLEKLKLNPVPPQQREETTSIYIQKFMNNGKRYVHANTLFRMLGVEPHEALDASETEGAALIHDLNQPVPQAWHGRYESILDGGTIEHIFDMRTGLSNMVRMLAVGGQIFHMSPMNGWVNHAFYQLSPALFYDFYQANGFEVRDAHVLQMSNQFDDNDPGTLIRYVHSDATLTPNKPGKLMAFVFIARKLREVEQIVIPTQQKYRERIRPEVVGADS